MSAVEQIRSERYDLIRANLRLSDENDRLRSDIEEIQKRVEQLLATTRQAQSQRRFWVWTALFFVAALLVLLIALTAIGVDGGWFGGNR